MLLHKEILAKRTRKSAARQSPRHGREELVGNPVFTKGGGGQKKSEKMK